MSRGWRGREFGATFPLPPSRCPRWIHGFAVAVAISAPVIASAGGLDVRAEPTPLPSAVLESRAGGRWDASFASPIVAALNGPVRELCWYQGSLVAGGHFSGAVGTTLSNLARWDGSAWRQLGDGLDGEVLALHPHGGGLIAAGLFEEAGDETRLLRVGRWDGNAWVSLGRGVSDLLGDAVHAIATYQDSLVIVAGSFNRVGDVPRFNGIAAWDGTSWSKLQDGFLSPGGQAYRALCLAVHQGQLIAGGEFLRAGSGETNRIAAWNGTSWSALGCGFRDGAVHALWSDGNRLIAAGSFTVLGDGTPARSIAAWDDSTQTWSPVGGGADGPILCLARVPGGLMVGGDFQRVYQSDGSEASAERLAIWSGATWESSSWTGVEPGCNGPVETIAESGGEVVVGGEFTMAGGDSAHFVARWDGTKLGPFGAAAGLGVDGEVEALLADGNGVLVAGAFSKAGEVSARQIARWDGATWSAIGEGFVDGGRITALGSYQGETIAAGEFTRDAGNTLLNHIARLTAEGWERLGDGISPGAGQTLAINDLEFYGEELIAAGRFDYAGSAAVRNVAAWDGVGWRPLGTVEEGPAGAIECLYTHDGRLIAAGHGQPGQRSQDPATCVLAWDGSAWTSLGSGLGQTTEGAPPVIYDLVSYAGVLVAGGEFQTEAEGVTGRNLARWDGSRWMPLGASVGCDGPVRALGFYSGDLVVAGDFTTVEAAGGAVEASHLARWTGSSWLAFDSDTGTWPAVLPLAAGDRRMAGGPLAPDDLGSPGAGFDGSVKCLAVQGAKLIVGGAFTRSGEVASSHIAFWHEEGIDYIPFASTVAGDTAAISVELHNPSDVSVRIEAFQLPAEAEALPPGAEPSPFLFAGSFRDSLEAGVEIPARSMLRTSVEFAPPRAGYYEAEARFDLGPFGERRRLLLGGEARALGMIWTSEYWSSKRPLRASDPVEVQMTFTETVDSAAVFYALGGSSAYRQTPLRLIDSGRLLYTADIPALAEIVSSGANPRAQEDRPSPEQCGDDEDRDGQDRDPGSWTARGVQFFVRAHEGKAELDYHSPRNPRCLRSEVENLLFPWDQNPKQYRLLSFPLELGSPWAAAHVGDDLGGQDNTRWRMFELSTDSTSLYRELMVAEDSLVQGRGYWLITEDAVRLDTGPDHGISTPCDSAFALRLRPGWNLIGHPFAFPVLWDSVWVEDAVDRSKALARSGWRFRGIGTALEPPFRWNPSLGSWQGNVTRLEPFEGYAVFLQGDLPATLRIPPREAVERAHSLGAGPGVAWQLRVRASTAGAADLDNLAGVAAGASAGPDEWDRTEPPFTPGGGISLHFAHQVFPPEARDPRVDALPASLGPTSPGPTRGLLLPGPALGPASFDKVWQGDCDRPPVTVPVKRYTHDVRPLPVSRPDLANGQPGWCEQWDFDVVVESDGLPRAHPVRLEFSGFEEIPHGAAVKLIDRDLQREMDLRASPAYAFVDRAEGLWAGGSPRFALLVGDPTAIQPDQPPDAPSPGSELPAFTTVRGLWPNPTAGGVAIRYEVARPARIGFEIHDPTGRRVRALPAEMRLAGRHEAFWDGALEDGGPAPRGVYFIRMSGSGGKEGHKVVVTR